MEAVAHTADGGGFALGHGELGHHGLDGGHLVAAAKGHEHRARADGGVKALAQALLAADVQIPGHVPELFGEGFARERHRGHLRVRDQRAGMLFRAVGVQELTADVHDGVALPRHPEPRLLRDLGHHGGFEVFRVGIADEGVGVLRRDHHRHALLALGDGQLRAVQPLILAGHAVQVDVQAVGQLADGHAHAARAKVVAALDQPRHLALAEEALELAFHDGVTLLHLSAAGFQALHLVHLGAARRAAAAVAAGTPAQKDNHIAGRGLLTAHVALRGRAHYRADLQTLGRVAGVVHLVHQPGRQADLVAIGAIPCGSSGHELALGELARHGLGHGHQRVRRAGHAHGLIDVRTARQRVADGAADAGGRAAEGFNLGGVVVRLVFEHEQPRFLAARYVHVDLDGAGVDFLAFVQIGKLSLRLERLGADGGHVHEVHGLGPALAARVHRLPQRQIALEGGFHRGLFDLHVVQRGQEGRVAAMIAPVGVDHANLGNGGIALLAPEIRLAEGQVVAVHGQAVLLHKGGNFLAVQRVEALQRLDGFGRVVLLAQRLLFGQVGLAALHGVDEVAADAVQLLGRGRAGEEIHARRAHGGPLPLTDQLDALLAARRTRVELPRQVFDGDHRVRALGQTVVGHVHGRLGKDHRHAAIKQRLLDALHVVAVEHAHARHALDEQNVPDLLQKALRLHGVFGRFFHIYAVNCHVHSPLCVSRAP